MQAAPPRLLDPTGRPALGAFAGVVEDTSLEGLEGVSRITLLLRQKRWLYFGVSSPTLTACACVIDLGYLASGFAFALDRRTGRLVDHHRVSPRLRRAVPDTPRGGVARFSAPFARISIASRRGAPSRLAADLGRGERRLRLDVEIDAHSGALVPLSLSNPLGGGRLTFTCKAAGLPARGRVLLGEPGRGGGAAFELVDALAALDYTHGLPPRELHWLWASGAGRASGGQTIGFNLVSGWNEEPESENAAWVDGRLLPLGRATFRTSPTLWEIEAPPLSLRFTPEAERRQDVDLGLIASHYFQPIGRFAGTLQEGGRVLRFEDVAGVTEDHRALW
jgi:hypothetical protein